MLSHTPSSFSEVDRLVHLAHEHLELDVIFVGEVVDDSLIYRAVAGDAASFGLTVGRATRLDRTYCSQMIRGDLPHVVPDSTRDGRVKDLEATTKSRIGAYLGVPLHLPNGELYGTLCALSHQPELDLNARDAKFLALVGQFMGDGLATERRLRRQRQLLEGVIDSRNVAIALQPIVDLLTGKCISLEALSRFPTVMGPPDVVFADAHQAGLGFELEQLAVQRALELLPQLAPEQSLAINISPEVAFALLPLVRDCAPLDRLVLELTEHAAVENYAEIRGRLQPLRERGLRLAVDDAGAGYASLRHIVELRPDIIKIDRSLIGGIEDDPGRRGALTTFVMLALDIGASIVAEGVETKGELVTVATLGVDAAQGYLLGRPSSESADLKRWTSGEALLSPAVA